MQIKTFLFIAIAITTGCASAENAVGCAWNAGNSTCNVGYAKCTDFPAWKTCSMTHDGDEVACKADAKCGWIYSQDDQEWQCRVGGIAENCDSLACYSQYKCSQGSPGQPPPSKAACDQRAADESIYEIWKRAPYSCAAAAPTPAPPSSGAGAIGGGHTLCATFTALTVVATGFTVLCAPGL